MKLNPCQSKIYRTFVSAAAVRFAVLVAGRRFGKTYLAVLALLAIAGDKPKSKVWYIAPTYKMAKENTWEILKATVPRKWILKIHETDLTMTLRNHAKIVLKGAEDPDSLRGPELAFVVFDEFQDIDVYAWEAVIRPTLATCGGRAFFIGTPRGYNHFYDLYQKSIDPDADKWVGFLYTTKQGGYVPDDELALARRETDERIFRQEFEASFETLAGRVYYKFNRNESVRSDLRDIGGDILVGMDFNVSPMTSVIGIKVADQFHVLDEIVIPDSNTEEMAVELQRRYGNLPVAGDQFDLLRQLGWSDEIPRRIVRVFPDPSGRARKTSAPVGQTDYTILQQQGLAVYAPKRAPAVMDRINTVNAMCCNAAGERRLFIHPRCKQLIKCLEGLTYKEGTNFPDKGMGLDHLPDALGYLIHHEFPILHGRAKRGELAA